MNSYELSRNFFDWCFENPEKVSTNHVAIYFFAVEHCNRLGWKQKFGFPSQMTMDALGIKKHQTYLKYFNELVDYGFFKLVEKSKNQYSANIISLVSAMPKKGRALGKAMVTHAAKQIESTGQSTGQSKGSIDKPITNNQITNNHYRAFAHLSISFDEFDKLISLGFLKKDIDEVLDSIENYKKNINYKSLFLTSKKWLQNEAKNKGSTMAERAAILSNSLTNTDWAKD